VAKFSQSRVWGEVPKGSTLTFEGTRISLEQSVRQVERRSHAKTAGCRHEIRESVSIERRLVTDRDTDRRTPRHSKRDKKLTRMHVHTESMIGVSLWCRGFGRLQASAALLRIVPGPGTDYQRPSDHQNCRSLPEASPGQNMCGGHWTDMASAEREPITGVWRRSDSPPTTHPCKNSSDLYQFQERPLAKVGWTCPPQSTPWRRHCSLHSSASSRPTRLFQH